MNVLGFEKLIYHHAKIEKIRTDEPQFPVHITASLGNYCNHKCRWCTVYAVQEEQVRHAPFERFVRFFEQAQKRGLRAVGYVGNGEPTAYPKFRELITEANRLGLEQGMFTNGQLLHRTMDEVAEFFTYVRISLDAGSTPTHDAMHLVQGQFDRIIENVRTLIARRKDRMPTVGIQYATHHENIADLGNAARIAREIGADYLSVKPVFIWGGGADPSRIVPNSLTQEDLLRAVAEVRRANETADFEIMYRPFQIDSIREDKNVLAYDRCVAGFFNLNMYEDGRLTCCSPGRVEVGTIDDDLVEIEQRVLATTKALDLERCPPSCRYHPLNHLVDTVIHPEHGRQYHKNFL